jgi:peptide/nickel transport system permease protein
MLALIARRVAGAAATLLVLSILLFLLVQALPGDPATSILGLRATPETVARIRHDFGLDQPLAQQYLTWLGRALRGNLGYSLATAGTGGAISETPVSDIVGQGLVVTLPLAALGMLLAILLGVPLGVLAATRRGRPRDVGLSSLAVLGISLPDFFVAFLLILLFSVRLRLLPSVGYVDLLDDPLSGLRTLALPILSVGIINAAAVARMSRASLLESLSRDYVLLARARGTFESVVVLKHALRNAFVPVLTTIGLQLGFLLGGVVVIEQVFGLPGVGRQLLVAVGQRDYPTIQALVLTMAAAFILVNLVVDLLYMRLDPSIRGASS